MSEKVYVSIDLDKIKYPNTGLHSFGMQFMKAMEKIREEENMDVSYWLPSKMSAFPLQSKRILKWRDRFFPLAIKKEEIFHQIFQLGKYMPGKDRKVVLTIHDLNFLYENSAKKAQKLKRKLQRNIDRSHRLVAISEFVKQDVLKNMQVGGKVIDVIYNGCSFYEGEQTDSPVYRPKGGFLFTVGTVLPKKNFHVLPVLLRDNDRELIIAGNISAYAREIMEEAERYGVSDRVKILGAVSDADKDWYYRHCDAFVFPSVAEGFGLPVIEALSYGKPVFISRHTCLPEIGRDYCYYFNFDFDRELMVKEFTEGMSHFPSRDVNTLIEYARSYSWECMAREYCHIYRELDKM